MDKVEKINWGKRIMVTDGCEDFDLTNESKALQIDSPQENLRCGLQRFE